MHAVRERMLQIGMSFNEAVFWSHKQKCAP
jgi:hypothetical protein